MQAELPISMNSSQAKRVDVESGVQQKNGSRSRLAYLLATPYTLVLLFFLVIPILAIVIISFWSYSSFTMKPAFVFDNYVAIFNET